MNDTEKIFLQLTGRAIFHVDTDFDPAAVDWNALYEEAVNQAMTLLIWDCMTKEERSYLAEPLALRWEQNALRHVMKNEELLYEQAVVIRQLESAGIPCVILKGSSAAACYPNPALRIMGDIDILVKPQQQMQAVEILQKHGYGEIDDPTHLCHLGVSKGDITVEVHKEPNVLVFNEDYEIAKKLQDFFADAVDRRKFVDGLPFLADDQQAVVLILHKLRHFQFGKLGLRQLVDWAVFVEKKLDEEQMAALMPRLKEFGLLTVTGVFTRSCIDYLYMPTYSAMWALNYDQTLSADVMAQVLEAGNFGRKANEINYGLQYFTDIHTSSRLTSLMKMLVIRCRIHWPLCEKYPFLMPVAPFVAYAKYLKLRREGKRAVLRPLSLYKKAGGKRKLYQELEPFVVRAKG